MREVHLGNSLCQAGGIGDPLSGIGGGVRNSARLVRHEPIRNLSERLRDEKGSFSFWEAGDDRPKIDSPISQGFVWPLGHQNPLQSNVCTSCGFLKKIDNGPVRSAIGRDVLPRGRILKTYAVNPIRNSISRNPQTD
jgi:hypothetical protein